MTCASECGRFHPLGGCITAASDNGLILRCALLRLHHLVIEKRPDIATLGHLLVAREALRVAVKRGDAGRCRER
jgi:hypothetical protein